MVIGNTKFDGVCMQISNPIYEQNEAERREGSFTIVDAISSNLKNHCVLKGRTALEEVLDMLTDWLTT